MEASGLADIKQLTLGISPKVYVPALGQIVVGVALILLGFDVEGRTAIGTGLGTFGLGFSAGPGVVVSETTEVDDGEVVFPKV